MQIASAKPFIVAIFVVIVDSLSSKERVLIELCVGVSLLRVSVVLLIQSHSKETSLHFAYGCTGDGRARKKRRHGALKRRGSQKRGMEAFE